MPASEEAMPLADNEFQWKCAMCGGWNLTPTNPPGDLVCGHCHWLNNNQVPVREADRAADDGPALSRR